MFEGFQVRFSGFVPDPELVGAWGERLQGFRGREPGILEPPGA